MKKTLLILTALFVYSYEQLNAQWVQTSGPYGGALSALAVDSPFVFTGGDYAGVYKSADNGFNWSRVTNGLTSLRVMSLIKASGNLFAGMDAHGIFLSINNGASWTQLTNGLPSPTNTIVFCFAASGNTIYAGTNQGIFMTTNFGASWTAINNGIVNLSTHSILVNGTDMFAATEDGVYYSSNGGSNWTNVSNGLNNHSMGQLAMNDTTLFASALSDDTLFVSHNNGNTWSPILYSTNFGWTTSLFVDSGKIYAGTNSDWLYVSQDNGLTWQQLTNGILHKGIGQISKIGATLIISTSGGIYQSSNDGLNWIKTDTSLAATYIYDLFMDGSNLFAACYGNGVSISPDGGNSWNVPNASVGNILSQSVVAKNNDVFTGSAITGILHSSDYGINWSPVNTGIPTFTNYFSIVANSNGILASEGQLYYTTNNGTSWTNITSGLTDFNRDYLAIDSNIVFNVTYNENIFRSTDGGMNWTQVYNGTSSFNPIWQIAISGNYVVAASQEGVLVSSDLGNTWNFANNGLTDVRCLSVEVLGVNIWASTFSGVFFSNNFGANWSYYHTGLDTLQWFFSFELDSNYIYGGARSCGVWKRSLSEFPLSVIEVNNSQNISLYPNPFSTETTLWTDKILKGATLTVYNSYGQEIKRIKNISGQTITLSRDNLPSGLYFIRLTQDNRVIATSKLVIAF